MENYDKQKRILESQGVRLSKPDEALRPKNMIEEAIRQAKKDFLPPIPPKYSDIRRPAEPVVAEDPPKIKPAPVKKPSGKMKIFFKIIFRAFIIGIVTGIILFGGYKAALYLVNKDFVSQEGVSSVAGVVESVGKLVELPSDEDPTVATIMDLAPLAGQEFFKDAKLGDKVLIFSKSKKAILYRPDENKIISIAPLNI